MKCWERSLGYNYLVLCFFYCSGYVDCIYEFMLVLREFCIVGGSEIIQNKDFGSYFIEVFYIEFEGVKVGVGMLIFILYYCDVCGSGF